jgi:lysophospholipase L1-like esterase
MMIQEMSPLKVRSIATFVLLLLGALLAGCTASSSSSPVEYYVSMGDSYSVGYQPAPVAGATSGYTAVVANATHLRLENFGCAGATTTSILESKGCVLPAATDAVAYPGESQTASALAFVKNHKAHVGLMTVSIGGNDITKCAADPNPVSCVVSATSTIRANVSQLASELRKAAGPGVPLIGLTYPDVVLGQWVYPPGHSNHSLATLSVTAFKTLINPTLAHAYEQAGGRFVDITAATSGYVPLSQTVTHAPYGTIPVAVARVCELTWYCSLGNIHANTAGYEFIGEQIVAAYEKLHRS